MTKPHLYPKHMYHVHQSLKGISEREIGSISPPVVNSDLNIVSKAKRPRADKSWAGKQISSVLGVQDRSPGDSSWECPCCGGEMRTENEQAEKLVCLFLIALPANSSRLTSAIPKGTQFPRGQGASIGPTDPGFGEEGKVGLVRETHRSAAGEVFSYRAGSCSRLWGTAISIGDNWLCQEQLLRATMVSECARTDPAIICMNDLTLMHFDLGVSQTQYYFKEH